MKSNKPISPLHVLPSSPVIAAVRKPEELAAACSSEAAILFILHAELTTLAETVAAAKEAGKIVFVHFDLIEGLSQDPAAVRFVRRFTAADGIISTRNSVIRSAKEEGFYTVQRFFVVDSQAESNVRRTVPVTQPDLIELMPGLIIPVIGRLSTDLSVPVIAGGLVESKACILELLGAGASGVSTGHPELWNV